MKASRLFVVFAILALAVSACGQPEPEKETVTVSVSPSSVSFSEEGGTASIQVTSNGSWYVETQGAWFKPDKFSGSGNASVTVTADINGGDVRTGALTFKTPDQSATVQVRQEAHVSKTLSLAEVRAMYKGTDFKIDGDVFAEGVVISDYRRNTSGGLNNYSSAKTIVVSDGKAGLMLYCTEENSQFARGDKVRLTLKDQTLSVYNNGSVQINGMPLRNIEKIGTETPVAKDITLEQLLSGEFESMYVAVSDVQLKGKFVGKSFVYQEEGKDVTTLVFEGKDGRDFDLFTSRYAVFKDELVPTGSGVLKGVAGKYGARIQMSISAISDWSGLTGERFSTGKVFNISIKEYPAWGDAAEFTVDVTSDVTWTASSSDPDFTVSPSQGEGSASVKVGFTDNPSTSRTRTAVITFKTPSTEVPYSEQTLTVTQQPYEVLHPDAVQAWMEMPAVPEDGDKAFFTHDMTYGGSKVRNYSFWLDLKNRVSLWVAYPLYSGMTSGVSRTDKWDWNPKVPRRYQGLASGSYSTTEYDRGHQLPSADRLCTTEANESTFYYTNITPQDSDLNKGLWEKLEEKVRAQVGGCDTLYVVTGCVLTTPDDPTIQYIKDNRKADVAVPKAYYKVLLKYKAGTANGGYSAIGFWVENRGYGEAPLDRSYARSVDDMEKLTGIDFFVNLKDEYQKAAEAKYDASSWGL